MKSAAGVVIALLLLVGCGRSDGPSTAASAADPCAVALAPHRGSSTLDQDVVRLQDKARQARDRLGTLEHLGWTFVAKARTSFDPGFYKLAEQTALCMSAGAPSAAGALLLRGHVLQSMHRFREAEELARDLVARRGQASDHGLLGDALMEQGKLAEAVKAYQAMMDQRPSPEAYVRAAHVRWTTGDLAGAISLMRMAVGTSGFRDPEAIAWANTRLALYHLQADTRAEATRRVDIALAAQGDYAPALLAKGRLLFAEGVPARAITPLARAAQLNPLPEYQWALIEALRAAGRGEEAAAVEAQLIRRGPQNDRRTVSLYLASLPRDAPVAVQLAEQELEARRDVLTLDALAWALRAAGRIEEARAYSNQALSQGTSDARLLYHAGTIAAALGHGEEAVRRLAQARAIEHMLLPSERDDLARQWAPHLRRRHG